MSARTHENAPDGEQFGGREDVCPVEVEEDAPDEQDLVEKLLPLSLELFHPVFFLPLHERFVPRPDERPPFACGPPGEYGGVNPLSGPV